MQLITLMPGESRKRIANALRGAPETPPAVRPPLNVTHAGGNGRGKSRFSA